MAQRFKFTGNAVFFKCKGTTDSKVCAELCEAVFSSVRGLEAGLCENLCSVVKRSIFVEGDVLFAVVIDPSHETALFVAEVDDIVSRAHDIRSLEGW